MNRCKTLFGDNRFSGTRGQVPPLESCMMRKLTTGISLGLLALAPAVTFAAADVRCSMTFTMTGWSAFYKTSTGTGTIKCSNGQSAAVKLDAKGGGLTFGKSSIENGQGEFSGVTGIEEVLGSYVAAEAHAGAVKSSKASVMTKGEVSLALSGVGRGWDLGVAFGRLTISR